MRLFPGLTSATSNFKTKRDLQGLVYAIASLVGSESPDSRIHGRVLELVLSEIRYEHLRFSKVFNLLQARFSRNSSTSLRSILLPVDEKLRFAPTFSMAQDPFDAVPCLLPFWLSHFRYGLPCGSLKKVNDMS